jgi:hypothetical protein
MYFVAISLSFSLLTLLAATVVCSKELFSSSVSHDPQADDDGEQSLFIALIKLAFATITRISMDDLAIIESGLYEDVIVMYSGVCTLEA